MKPATTEQSSRIPPQIMQDLSMQMGKLQASLLAFDPEMPNHLRESHRLLITYPESVALLDDVEIAALIQAAEKHTQTQIVTAIAKGKGSTSKKKISADDL